MICFTAGPHPFGGLVGTRSNAGAGAVVLIAGAAIAIAAQQPWVAITGPTFGLSLKDVVDVGIVPRGTDLGDTEERQLLLVAGSAIAVCGGLLMLTRVRVLGPILRVFSLLLVTLPALLAIAVWEAVGETSTEVFNDPDSSLWDQARAGMRDLLEGLGVIRIEPAAGLYVLSAACVLVVVGCLIPARRMDHRSRDGERAFASARGTRS